MVSLALRVAAGDRDAVQRRLAEQELQAHALLLRGLLLPPIEVQVDGALAPGRFAIVLNGVRGPAEHGDAADRLWTFVEAHGAALLDDDGMRALLDLLHDSHPVLAEAALARFELPFLRRRLQALLAEGIPVNDLRNILEALLLVRGLQSAPPGVDEAALRLGEAGYDREVRHALRAAIVSPHLRGGKLSLHLVDEAWRARLTAPLDAAEGERLRQAVAVALADATEAVVLTDDATRPALRDLLAPTWPGVTVLGFGDLPPDLEVQQLEEVGRPPG